MRTIVLTAISTVTILVATLTPAPVPGQEEAGVLEEITVTAARREQSMQDLPASVTAFTAEDYRSVAQDLFLSLGFSEIVLSQPRTWGVEVGYRF